MITLNGPDNWIEKMTKMKSKETKMGLEEGPTCAPGREAVTAWLNAQAKRSEINAKAWAVLASKLSGITPEEEVALYTLGFWKMNRG